MRKTRLIAVFAALAFAVTALAADNIKSGPQPGEKVPGPFEPLNVTGSSAGQKACLFCKNGNNPVVMIFARECSEPVTKLIKRVDQTTAEHKDQKMGSFVVFLSDSPEMKDKLKELADREQIRECVLSMQEPTGPEAYKVSPDADVTVVLYTKRQVKANHAFAKGELQDRDIDTICSEVSQILPQQ